MSYIGNSTENITQARSTVYTFTSTAGQTAYSGVDNDGQTLDLLRSNQNAVYLNGSRLILTSDYTLLNDVLTLVSGAGLNDVLVIETQTEVANVATYTKAESDARYFNSIGDIVNGNLQVTGSVISGALTATSVALGDSQKATFGASDDLQIYHDGNNSIIDEVGTGHLFIRATNVNIQNIDAAPDENMITTEANGAVNLYHNNASKLATTSSGVDVTGTVTADGFVSSGSAYLGPSGGSTTLVLAGDSSTTGGFLYQDPNQMILSTVTAKPMLFRTTNSERMRITSTGNVGIGTSSPNAALQIAKGLTTAGGPAAGAATGSACFGNDTSGSAYGLVVGADGFGTGYISAQRTDGNATTYPLIIQPNGGNVGIGTTTPTTALTIRKAIASAAYGQQASMIEFKSYFSGYDTETVKSAIYSGVSGEGTLNTQGGYMSFHVNNNGTMGEKMRIEKSGIVTTPNQPAWFVSGSGWHTTTTAGVLPLTTANMNIGNHFNTSTYRFTAPVSGVYQVNTIFYMEAAGQAVLKKNGADYAPADALIVGFTNEGTKSELASASFCIYLSSGDYIQLGARNGQTVRVYLGHTHFSGHLVG